MSATSVITTAKSKGALPRDGTVERAISVMPEIEGNQARRRAHLPVHQQPPPDLAIGLPPGIDHRCRVTAALALVLVDHQGIRAGLCLPVDGAHGLPRGMVPQAVELCSSIEHAGAHVAVMLTHPRRSHRLGSWIMGKAFRAISASRVRSHRSSCKRSVRRTSTGPIMNFPHSWWKMRGQALNNGCQGASVPKMAPVTSCRPSPSP